MRDDRQFKFNKRTINMIDWNKDLKKSANHKRVLVKFNRGIFSGGWDFAVAIPVGGKFYCPYRKIEIEDVSAWAEVKM